MPLQLGKSSSVIGAKLRDIDSSHWAIVLHCTICFDVYQEPTILGCGHTFCRRCLDDLCRIARAAPRNTPRLLHVAGFSCPLCRYFVRFHHFPRYTPINRILKDVIENYAKSEDYKQIGLKYLQEKEVLGASDLSFSLLPDGFQNSAPPALQTETQETQTVSPDIHHRESQTEEEPKPEVVTSEAQTQTSHPKSILTVTRKSLESQPEDILTGLEGDKEVKGSSSTATPPKRAQEAIPEVQPEYQAEVHGLSDYPDKVTVPLVVSPTWTYSGICYEILIALILILGMFILYDFDYTFCVTHTDNFSTADCNFTVMTMVALFTLPFLYSSRFNRNTLCQ